MTEYQRLGAVILAAGNSSRLGQPKQLVELGGRPLIVRAIRLIDTLVDEICVVLGANHERMQRHLPTSVNWVLNAKWAKGPGTSIGAGVAHLVDSGCAGFLIMTVDQWKISITDMSRLVGAWRDAPAGRFAAEYQGTLGVPAIFCKNDATELMSLTDQGAKHLLVREKVGPVPMESASVDLDTPSDLTQAQLDFQDG